MILLPSKKVLSVFILMAALVASIIIVFGRDKASSAINFASNLVAGEKISIPENSNWQDELSSVSENAGQVKPEESPTDEATTDIVSKTLMSNYLAMKESGSLDKESAQKLIDQTINYIDQTGSKVNQITAAQLNIVADNGKQSMIDYGENLGNIIKSKKPTDLEKELNAFAQAIQSGDQSNTSELDKIIASYEKAATKLLKMPVPKTFAKAHLDITNGTRGMAQALAEMKKAINDPIRGLTALGLYQESTTLLSQAIAATIVFITQNNIVYKQGSGGYYLLYGI